MTDDGPGGPQPENEYFELMAEVAQRHWWYRARRRLLVRLLRERLRPGAVALDVGCGTGETLTALERAGARTAVGTDLSRLALALGVRSRGRRTAAVALAEHLPFGDRRADCVVAMDVIEHLDDDVTALRELVRVAKPGATVYLTVPAYQFLWSEHDVRAAHRRRYTAPMLRQAALAAGIEIDRLSYYNSFLVLPALLLRRTPLRRLATDTDEETSMMHPAVDRLFLLLSQLEQRWLTRFQVPFGLSIVLVGRVADRRISGGRPPGGRPAPRPAGAG